MSPFEREYFISRIRTGIVYVKVDNFRVKVLTPTFEDVHLASEIFMETYDQARSDDILTQDEMVEWLTERNFWGQDKIDQKEQLEKNLEKLKVEIFQTRTNKKMVDTIRAYLRATEKGLAKLENEKNEFFENTCEGLGFQEQQRWLFKRCCFVGSEPVNFEEIDQAELYFNYAAKSLDEKQLRYLARNDPWRGHWVMKDHCKLFMNPDDRVLSTDQQGLIIWSNMYDNIQESLECPTEDVINDDDMLDGWFIIQRRKQESEKAKSELEQRTNNEKIANSDEILVMASNKKEANAVHNMNDINGDMIRKQRLNTVKRKGKAVDLDFQDRKIEVSNQQREMFKGHTRR